MRKNMVYRFIYVCVYVHRYKYICNNNNKELDAMNLRSMRGQRRSWRDERGRENDINTIFIYETIENKIYPKE